MILSCSAVSWDQKCHPTGTQVPWRLRSSLHRSSHCFHHLPSNCDRVSLSLLRCRQCTPLVHLGSGDGGERRGMEYDGNTHTFQSAPQECQSLEIGSMWHSARDTCYSPEDSFWARAQPLWLRSRIVLSEQVSAVDFSQIHGYSWRNVILRWTVVGCRIFGSSLWYTPPALVLASGPKSAANNAHGRRRSRRRSLRSRRCGDHHDFKTN